MRPAPVPGSKKPTFGCAFVFFPFVFVVFGWTAIWAGNQLAPQSNADAVVFRTDRSCAPNLYAKAPPGACTTVDAEVYSARMETSGTGKTQAHTPKVYLRYADGSFHGATLDGGGNSIFVYAVASGARARAQSFHGTLVRVASGSDVAETIDAPDVNAETASEMPKVGTFAILVAVFLVGARIVYLRRSARAA